jgi:peptide/nickel transport system permease protein
MNAAGATEAVLEYPAARRLELKARRSVRWRRLTLWSGVSLIAGICLLSAVGHFLYPDPNEQNLAHALEAPSFAHPFGTDGLGRDVFARTLAGTWIDLAVAVGSTYLAVLIGVMLGSVAGYFRGWGERIIMRSTDVVIAFPFLVLVIAIVTIVGPGITGVFIGLAIGGAAFYTRLARAEMLVLTEKPFIQAAQTLGFSDRRVILRHAVPNLIRTSVVYSMSDLVINITWVASMSYLGLGVQPPTPEWGSIIAEGQQYLLTAWWISTLPGVVLVLVAIGFSLIGDRFVDRLRAHRTIGR